MKILLESIRAEFIKVKSSIILYITFIVAAIMPLMMAFMAFVLKNPELAHKLGLLGVKARLAGSADWPSYLNLLGQGVFGIELVLFGFITSWIFGMEYSDRTVKDILALPMPRFFIPLSKFIVAALWCIIIYILVFCLAIFFGNMVGLPQWDPAAVKAAFFNMALASFTLIYLGTTTAFIASATRGYLASVGFVILTAVLGNFAGVLGFAEYYPWAIPMMYAAKSSGLQPGNLSWIIVIITGIAGAALLHLWWRYADQS